MRAFFQKIGTQTYSVVDGPISSVIVSFQNIKSVTAHPHKFNYQRNQTCYFLPEILKIAKYVGCSLDIKGLGAPGHGNLQAWYYYSFKLNHELSYITIKESKDGLRHLHSIQDADNFDLTKVKEKP